MVAGVNNPFVPSAITLYDNTETLDRILKGLFIKTKDEIVGLFYETPSKITYIGTLNYLTQTLVYVKILPNMPKDYQTLAIFVSENIFFTASKGTTQFDTLSST